MFFQKIALIMLLLLMPGCVGRTLREDAAYRVVPAGTADIISRSLNPQLHDFAAELNYSTFPDDRSYGGYYIPLIGITMDANVIGRACFEADLVHEILHAVHFNGWVDKDRLQAVIERLLTDPAQTSMVEAINSLTWDRWIYTFFEQSEYFARIGAEIVNRHGIGIPDYLWEVYRPILHPHLRANGRRYPVEPMPTDATVTLTGNETRQQNLLASTLGILPSGDNVLPRRDIVSYTVQLAIPFEHADRATFVQCTRRSTGAPIVLCAGKPLVADDDNKVEVTWTPTQAVAIMQAWLEHDLDIALVEPIVAFGPR